MKTKQDQNAGRKAAAKQLAKPKKSATQVASKTKSNAKKARSKTQVQSKNVEQNREEVIAEVAYKIAQQRDFKGNCALDDWLQAEQEVDAKYSCGQPVKQ